MELVVDANIIFAALIKRGFSFDLLIGLGENGFTLLSPQWLKEELESNKKKLCELRG